MITPSIIKSSFQQELQNVPQEIRHWFGSENVTYLIMDINQKLGLKGEDARIIPKLLLRLEVRDLRPQYFIQELSSQLNISHSSAKTLAIEIEEKILEPIKQPLLSWEVDINLIKAGHLIGEKEKEMREGEIEAEEREEYEIASLSARNDDKGEAKKSEIEKPTLIEIRKPEPPIKIIGVEEEKAVSEIEQGGRGNEIASPSVRNDDKIAATEEEPMIIHEETEFEPLSESKKSLKSLGGLFGFLKKKEKPGEVKPVKAEIEGPGFFKKIIEELKPIETKIKVVDYTEVPDITNNQQPITNNKPLAASEPEPPIRVVDNQQPTTDNLQHTESPIKIIEEEKPIKESETEEVEPLEEIRRVASEAEPPIRIIDDQQPTEAPESPLVVSGAEPLETRNEEIKEEPIAELPSDEPIIITQETEPKPKKNFFSGLTSIFKKKGGLSADISKDIEAGKREIAELPIKIVDEENHQITNQNEYANKIEGIEKIELEEKIEKPKDEIMITTMTEEKKEELSFDDPVIISEEPEEIKKKRFFSGLTSIFKKKAKVEIKIEKKDEQKIEKVEEIK